MSAKPSTAIKSTAEQPDSPPQDAQPITPDHPSPVAPPPTSPVPAPPLTQSDPGEIWSIFGIVFLVMGLTLPGFVCSLVGRSKSASAGHSTTLGTVGAIINGILLALTILILSVIVIVIIVGAVAGSGAGSDSLTMLY